MQRNAPVFDLLLLHGHEFLQPDGLPLGAFLKVSCHLDQPDLELRLGHGIDVDAHYVKTPDLGEFRVGLCQSAIGALVQLLSQVLDLGHDLGFV